MASCETGGVPFVSDELSNTALCVFAIYHLVCSLAFDYLGFQCRILLCVSLNYRSSMCSEGCLVCVSHST